MKLFKRKPNIPTKLLRVNWYRVSDDEYVSNTSGRDYSVYTQEPNTLFITEYGRIANFKVRGILNHVKTRSNDVRIKL
jgi:hypothetical protein